MNPGRVGFIKLMKWKRVAIVFQDIEYFRLVGVHFSINNSIRSQVKACTLLIARSKINAYGVSLSRGLFLS